MTEQWLIWNKTQLNQILFCVIFRTVVLIFIVSSSLFQVSLVYQSEKVTRKIFHIKPHLKNLDR